MIIRALIIMVLAVVLLMQPAVGQVDLQPSDDEPRPWFVNILDAWETGCSDDVADLKSHLYIDDVKVAVTPEATNQDTPLFATLHPVDVTPMETKFGIRVDEGESAVFPPMKWRTWCTVSGSGDGTWSNRTHSGGTRQYSAVGRARNGASVMFVIGQDPPPQPTVTVEAAGESAVVRWAADESGRTESFLVAWGGGGSVVQRYGVGAGEHNVTGLTDNMRYTLRVVAEVEPWKVGSPDVSFKTKNISPKPPSIEGFWWGCDGDVSVRWHNPSYHDAQELQIHFGPTDDFVVSASTHRGNDPAVRSFSYGSSPWYSVGRDDRYARLVAYDTGKLSTASETVQIPEPQPEDWCRYANRPASDNEYAGPLVPPQITRAERSDDTLTITWTADRPTDHDRFEIHAGAHEGFHVSEATKRSDIRDTWSGGKLVRSGIALDASDQWVIVRVARTTGEVADSDARPIVIPNVAPGAPRITSATDRDDLLDLEWAVPADDDIETFEIHLVPRRDATLDAATLRASVPQVAGWTNTVRGVAMQWDDRFAVVVAVDYGGLRTASDPFDLDRPDPPPPRPEVLAAVRGPKGVAVEWDTVTPPDLVRFEIHSGRLEDFALSSGTKRWSGEGGEGPRHRADPVRISANDAFVVVRAVDAAGQHTDSIPIPIQTPKRPPPAPKIIGADATNGMLHVSWRTVITEELDHFEVHAGPAARFGLDDTTRRAVVSEWQVGGDLGARDVGLELGDAYVVVRAVGHSGLGADSEAWPIEHDPAERASPRIRTAAIVEGRLQASWSGPSGFWLASYEVHMGPGPELPMTDESRRKTISPVPADGPYEVRAVGVNPDDRFFVIRGLAHDGAVLDSATFDVVDVPESDDPPATSGDAGGDRSPPTERTGHGMVEPDGANTGQDTDAGLAAHATDASRSKTGDSDRRLVPWIVAAIGAGLLTGGWVILTVRRRSMRGPR